MRWWLFFLCSWQLAAQSTLAVDLPDGTYQVFWNQHFLGNATGGFRLMELAADTVELEISSAADPKLHILRELFVNGVDNYHYAVVPVGEQGHWRLRYRGHLGLPSHPILEVGAAAVLVEEVVPAPELPLEVVAPAIDSVIVETEVIVPAIDSVAEVEAEQTIDSALVTNLVTVFEGICALETEFERLQQSRELALVQSLDEADFRKLLRCMQFDNSRLLFLHDVRKDYLTEGWFNELADTFDFNLSRQQFMKMLENPSP